MAPRYKQLGKRLTRVEDLLAKRSRPAEIPMYHQIELEARHKLPPEELRLVMSAFTARKEGRYHTLEENAAEKRYWKLLDVVARRHGHAGFVWLLPTKPTERDVAILSWGRRNASHLNRLSRELEGSKANASASTIAPDPASETANSTAIPHSNP